MKRTLAIFTIASAIACMASLMLLLVDMSLCPGDGADAVNDVADFQFAVSRGGIWCFNHNMAYTGSIIGLTDDATEEKDWSWGVGRYGIEQESSVDSAGQLLGIDRYGDLPGIYYRSFGSIDDAWWTIAVSLWYPIVLFGILPICRLTLIFHGARFSLLEACIALTVFSAILSLATKLGEWGDLNPELNEASEMHWQRQMPESISPRR